MLTKNKRLIAMLCVVAILLSVPLIAMQFTSSVDWDLFDFIAMSGLLLTTGVVCEIVLRKVKKSSHRIAFCLTVLIIFLLAWAELAVGIFGTPFAGS